MFGTSWRVSMFDSCRCNSLFKNICKGIVKEKFKLSWLILLPAHDKIEQVLPWHYHQVPGKRTIQTDFFNHYYMDQRIKNNKKKHTFELRQARRLGVKPNPLSWRTLCWVGFVFYRLEKIKISVDHITWMFQQQNSIQLI